MLPFANKKTTKKETKKQGRNDDKYWKIYFLLSLLPFVCLQVMKTYHMYHSESISAESKLKDAEKQEEKHIGKANDIGSSLLRYGHDERPQRRSSVKKMEKMKEKVCLGWPIPTGWLIW